MKQCGVGNRFRVKSLILLFFLFCVPITAAADESLAGEPLLSLEQVEPLVSQGPEVTAAFSSAARDEALKEFNRQMAGTKYFGIMTFGNNNEPVFNTDEERLRYNTLSLSGGLSFPLLGTWQKEKITNLEAETTVMQSRHQAERLLVSKLAEVRKAYTTLWLEQQKEELAKRFLSTESETTAILENRQVQGLILPVDRLGFLAVYPDVKRDLAASRLRRTQALEMICLATGRKWEVSTNLKSPSLPILDGQIIDINTYPEVIFQSSLVAQYEKLKKEKTWLSREANLSLGVTAIRDFPGATGTGAYFSLSITEPAKASGANDPAKLAAAADLNKVKREAELTRLKMVGQAEETLATADYAAADVNVRVSQLLVMSESIREKILRRELLPGDVFEQLQHAKSQYYKTAITMLESEERYLHAAIDVVSYVYPNGFSSEPQKRFFPINANDGGINRLLSPAWLGADSMQDVSVPLDFSDIPNLSFPVVPIYSKENIVDDRPILSDKAEAAVYVWDAEPFLNSKLRAAAINKIADAGFSRILISFTPTQLSCLSASKGRSELETFLAEAQGKGLRVDLLLGDPQWAEPEHKEELTTLIKRLEGFKFGGVHLDIEPDSLPDASARREELLCGLADTVKAVKKSTVLPVSIYIPPRYLEGDLGMLARQKLLGLGLEEVVVMIYSDNPYTTIERMTAIITENPNVKFSLAQSVEKNIPSTESYAAKSRRQISDAMHLLVDKLAGYGLRGIYIQDWEEYEKGEKP